MTSPAPEIPEGATATEWREGWPVVLAATVGYGTGSAMIMMTAGLFIKPMREALGWSTAAVTIAPLISLVWAIGSPFCGAAVDRFGARQVAVAGMIALAGCLIALATLPITSFTLYGTAVLIGIIAPMANVAPYARGVAGWFRYNFGAALGVTLNGVSLVALIAVPAISAAIYNFGWRAGYLTAAALMLGLGLPIVFALLRDRPTDLAQQAIQASEPLTGYTVPEAMRDARFWAFMAVFGLGSISLGGFLGHLQPMLASRGFGIAEATALGVLYAVSVSLGRIIGGILLDRLWDCMVAAFMLAFAGMGGFVLGHVEADTAYVIVCLSVFLVGMGQGAEADFIAYFGRRAFGLRAYSTLLGFMTIASSLGMAAGGFSFAKIYDLQGDYKMACYLGGACFLLCAVIMVAVGIGERARVWRARPA